MYRIEVEASENQRNSDTSSQRHEAEQHLAMCEAALEFLADESPNPNLTAAQSQLLLEDMRRTASACATPIERSKISPIKGNSE